MVRDKLLERVKVREPRFDVRIGGDGAHCTVIRYGPGKVSHRVNQMIKSPECKFTFCQPPATLLKIEDPFYQLVTAATVPASSTDKCFSRSLIHRHASTVCQQL